MGNRLNRRITNATCTDERGSSLILVMIFLSAIGVLSAALVSYELTINKQSFSTRRMQARETGVNTGIEWMINSLRQGRDGLCQGGYDNEVMAVANREVALTCRAATSDGPDGSTGSTNNVALYLNAATPPELNVVRTSGELGVDGRPTVIGPVYNGNPADGKTGWDLQSRLVVNGDVLGAADGDRCDAGAVSDVPDGLKPLYANVKRCSMALSTVTPPPIPPPCEAVEKCVDPKPQSLDADGRETDGQPACRIFFPGLYKTAPQLAGNNYFAPGVYTFDFDAEWLISSALRGGDPAPQSEVAEAEPVISSVPRCAGAPEPASPWGVTFVFAGGARMRVGTTARVELFSWSERDVALPNVVAAANEVTEWANPAKQTLSRDLVSVVGGEPEFILHAGVFAPWSAVTLAGEGAAIETIRNTVVVGRLELRADAPISGSLGIVSRTGRAKKYVLMARSCAGDRRIISHTACTSSTEGELEQDLCAIATATVYDDERRTVHVDSWRVDRDPSPTDPSTCSLG